MWAVVSPKGIAGIARQGEVQAPDVGDNRPGTLELATVGSGSNVRLGPIPAKSVVRPWINHDTPMERMSLGANPSAPFAAAAASRMACSLIVEPPMCARPGRSDQSSPSLMRRATSPHFFDSAASWAAACAEPLPTTTWSLARSFSVTSGAFSASTKA
jgi:hypothetical protein